MCRGVEVGQGGVPGGGGQSRRKRQDGGAWRGHGGSTEAPGGGGGGEGVGPAPHWDMVPGDTDTYYRWINIHKTM